MAIQDDLAKADKSKSKKQLDPLYSRKVPGVNSSAPKKSAVDKSGYNMKIKVSQAQIDAVKKLGMSAAIKSAGSMSPAMKEAATRLYGAKRINAASAPAAKSGNSSNYGTGAGKPAMTSKAAPKTGPGKAPYSTAKPKKNQSVSDRLKIVGGTAAAIGVLAATKGKGAALAARLSPGLAKSGAARLLGTGTAKKFASVKEAAGTKAMSTAGRAAAKAKRPVSQSQYDAMREVASAKGVKPVLKKTMPAKKVTPSNTKSTPVKKTTRK
jgi:hypothetical protein